MITTTKNNTKCVILYSRRHFDPNKKTELNESSAGKIAASIYESLSKIPNLEVQYFDAFDFTEWQRFRVDVLITLIDNMPLATWYFKPRKTIVVAVNQHPLVRLENALNSRDYGVPSRAIVPSDGAFQPFFCLKKANVILCVGNLHTASTFKRYLKNSYILDTHYQASIPNFKKERSPGEIKKILVLMSSIGYRKGFDRIKKEIEENSKVLSQFEFHLIGHPEGVFWKKQVDDLTNKYANVVDHGWILNDTILFKKLLGEMDIALFPTREEGLVGSLLECLESGILCMHTPNSGLDNSIEELALPEFGTLNLENKLLKLSQMSTFELDEIYNRQISDMRNQFSISPKIADKIAMIIEDGILFGKSKLKFYATLHTLIKVIRIKNFRMIKIRLQLIQLRIIKAKLSITFPITYKLLKSIIR